MALSNVMQMMAMQNADYQTAMTLQKAGCKPVQGQDDKFHNLSERFAAGCPADQTQFSQQALAALDKQLENIQHGGSQAQLTPQDQTHQHHGHHHGQAKDHGVH